MQCPIDGTQLVMADRSGVEIDYCPKCRGVWLDRGELDKIIERSAAPAAAPYQGREQPRHEAPREEYRGDYRGGSQGHPHKKKREGFLSDLFDF